MSKLTSSLVLEEFQEQDITLEQLLLGRHLSISSVSADVQPLIDVVRISGSITVSF